MRKRDKSISGCHSFRLRDGLRKSVSCGLITAPCELVRAQALEQVQGELAGFEEVIKAVFSPDDEFGICSGLFAIALMRAVTDRGDRGAVLQMNLVLPWLDR